MPDVPTSMLALWSLLLAFAVTSIAIPLLNRVAVRTGFVDTPGHRKTHARPTPNLGGIALLVGLVAATQAVLRLSDGGAPLLGRVGELSFAMIVGCLVAIRDDRTPLSAWQKLLGQVAAIVASLVVVGTYAEAAAVPGSRPLELFAVCVVWSLAVCNGVNLIDGRDGLAGAAVAATLLGGAFYAHAMGDGAALVVCAGGAGATLAFVRMNWAPAKIFLGDNGTTGLGILLAIVFISIGPPPALGPLRAAQIEGFFAQMVIATVFLSYPLLELVTTVARRSLRGKSIGSADRAHLHDRLARRGWSPAMTASLAACFSALAGGAAVVTAYWYQPVSTMLLVLLGASAVGLVHASGHTAWLNPARLRAERVAFAMCRHFSALQIAKMRATTHRDQLLGLIDEACEELGVARFELWTRGAGELRHSWSSVRGAYGSDSRMFGSLEAPRGEFGARWEFVEGGRGDELETEYRRCVHEVVATGLEMLCRHVSDSREGVPSNGRATPRCWELAPTRRPTGHARADRATSPANTTAAS